MYDTQDTTRFYFQSKVNKALLFSIQHNGNNRYHIAYTVVDETGELVGWRQTVNTVGMIAIAVSGKTITH